MGHLAIFTKMIRIPKSDYKHGFHNVQFCNIYPKMHLINPLKEIKRITGASSNPRPQQTQIRGKLTK